MRLAIQSDTLAGMADAVRGLTRDDVPLTPPEMAAAIGACQLGIPFYHGDHVVNGRWVRPEGWPDLDALKAQIPEGESCVYLTYVLSRAPDQAWVGMYANGGAWVAERGHVEGGAFVADESTSHSSKQYHRQMLDPADGDVQLWRMRSTAKIVQFGLASTTGTNAQNFATMSQPCVEKAGKLPYATNLSTGMAAFNTATYSAITQTTYHLERDSMDYGGVVTTCANMFYCSFSLQEIDMSGWETADWRPTSLAHMFNSCYSLRSLDLSGWDTSGWSTTAINSMFNSCFALTRLDMHGLDVSGWRPTTLDSLFANCRSLQHLDMTGWDTSDWPVNIVSNVFSGCWSLPHLDLSVWDTTYWPVAGSASAFIYNCYALQDVVLPDTSGWSPTTTRYLFEGCGMLQTCPQIDFNEASTCTYFGVPGSGFILRDYGGRKRINITHNYRNCVLLTHESLINILEALPVVSSAKSLQLGPTNLLKLTEEEKAIATAKGWSVVS